MMMLLLWERAGAWSGYGVAAAALRNLGRQSTSVVERDLLQGAASRELALCDLGDLIFLAQQVSDKCNSTKYGCIYVICCQYD
jgi:hypothetical protein